MTRHSVESMQHSPERAEVVSGLREARWLRFVFATGLVLVLYFCGSLLQVWEAGRSETFAKGDGRVDAIVVLGAAQYDGRPSPQLRARLDHALSLWRREAARLVVVTGGKQVGDRFTEAEAGRSYLVEHGVPIDVIVVEPRGTSTYESLRSTSTELAARGLRNVVVVSDPYHVLRATLVAREVGLAAQPSATRTGVTVGATALGRNVREALGVMIGRVIGFRQLEAWLQ